MKPIIFCHYGNSDYLQYTLRCARISNPKKRIVLLGDYSNRKTAWKCGVEHYFFQEFDFGERIKTFHRVYKLVQGERHNHMKGGADWVKFVFIRWFFVSNFIETQKINAFWHFDSDNLLLEDLGTHEYKFMHYDCTEQCNGKCMNGYVADSSLVQRYIDKINELFQRENYLETQQREFNEINPAFAFTEMRAYVVFKQEEKIKSFRLNTIIDNTTFDDCICFENGMEYDLLSSGQKIKKVFLYPDGRFVCQRKEDGTLVQMNSLNLSWVPLYIFYNAFQHSKKRNAARTQSISKMSSVPTLASKGMPLHMKSQSLLLRVGRRIKRQLTGT
jgi:hypothetical protein